MLNKLKQLKENESGQGLIEYALILVLVAIIVIAILLLLGPSIGNVFSEVTTRLRGQDAAGGTGGGGTFSVAVSASYSSGHNAQWTVTCNGVATCQSNVTCQFYRNPGPTPNGSDVESGSTSSGSISGTCSTLNHNSVGVRVTVGGASDTTGTVSFDGVLPSTCRGTCP